MKNKKITILVPSPLARKDSVHLKMNDLVILYTKYQTDNLLETAKRLEKICHLYEDYDINLISHSAGSEIILCAKLPPNVKKWTLWSPSMLVPQNVSKTFPKKGKYLLHGGKQISKKIANDLDNCDTAKLLENITIPIKIYSSKEGTGWSKYYPVISVPYEHNYTDKEWEELYKLSK